MTSFGFVSPYLKSPFWGLSSKPKESSDSCGNSRPSSETYFLACKDLGFPFSFFEELCFLPLRGFSWLKAVSKPNNSSLSLPSEPSEMPSAGFSSSENFFGSSSMSRLGNGGGGGGSSSDFFSLKNSIMHLFFASWCT